LEFFENRGNIIFMISDDRELFKGAAVDYARFRAGYPKEFFDYVMDYFHLDGKRKLLDLGCGTGQITISLAPYFEKAIGIDIDKDMLTEAKRQAEKAGVKNIKWLEKKAEDISSDLGFFRLASFGASFHWMEQDKVLAKVYEILEPNGGLVIVSGSSSVWKNTEKELWKVKCKEIIQKYLGPKRRAGNTFYSEPKEKFENIISRSKFGTFDKWTHPYERKKTIEDIIGLLYTTSFASRSFFGDKIDDFERELKEALLVISPTGEFIERNQCEALLALKSGI